MTASEFLPAISDDVYVGFWINRSLSAVRGATLTLDRQSGGLLIAFLALFVSTTGRSFWKIARFILHCYLSSSSRNDGLHHQKQAILRNARLPNDAIVDLSHASMLWRRRTAGAVQRVLPVTTIAALVSLGFAVAGIFSSKVAGESVNEALLSGRVCDLALSETGIRRYVRVKDQIDTGNQQILEYFGYAMQCYRNETYGGIRSCETLTQSTLQYTSNLNASCPFSDEICKSKSDNLALDTGYLDSYKHLGMNRGPRFLLRRKTQCAPLVTHDYSNIYTDPRDSSYTYVDYMYGNTSTAPYTYQRHFRPNATGVGRLPVSPPGDYAVEVESVVRNHSPFRFIPQLSLPFSQTSLYFLEATTIDYMYRTEDPWFSAKLNCLGGNGTFCLTDQPSAPVGCATIHLYCNPNFPEAAGCIDVGDDIGTTSAIADVWPDPADQAVLRPLFKIIHRQVEVGSIDFYRTKGLPNLLSRNSLSVSSQLGIIPNDQWKKEFEYLHQANLASIQLIVVDFARGLSRGLVGFCGEKDSPECRRLCYSQKIRSPNYYSFSVLGMSIILVGGAIIIVLSTFLEEVVNYVAQVPMLKLSQNHRFMYACAEWQANSTLQLQRQAHEGLGLGMWSRANETVPVTEPGDQLGTLDVSDKKHPRLVTPEEVSDVGKHRWSAGSRPSALYMEIRSTD